MTRNSTESRAEHSTSVPASAPVDSPSLRPQGSSSPTSAPSTPVVGTPDCISPDFLGRCNAIASASDDLVLLRDSFTSTIRMQRSCCEDPLLSQKNVEHTIHGVRTARHDYVDAVRSTIHDYVNSTDVMSNTTPPWRTELGKVRMGCLAFLVILSYFIDPRLVLLPVIFLLCLVPFDLFGSSHDFRERCIVRGFEAVVSTADGMLYVLGDARTIRHKIPISLVSCFRMALRHWKVNNSMLGAQVLNVQRTSYYVEVVTLEKTILLGNYTDERYAALFVADANKRLKALRECGKAQPLAIPVVYDDDNPYSSLQLPLTSTLVSDLAFTSVEVPNIDVKVTRIEDESVQVSWYQPGEAYYLPKLLIWPHCLLPLAVFVYIFVALSEGIYSEKLIRAFLLVYLVATFFPINHNSISWKTISARTRKGTFFGLRLLASLLFRRHHIDASEIESMVLNRSQVDDMRRTRPKYGPLTVSGRRFELELRLKSGRTIVLKSLYLVQAFIIARELYRLLSLANGLDANLLQSHEDERWRGERDGLHEAAADAE